MKKHLTIQGKTIDFEEFVKLRDTMSFTRHSPGEDYAPGDVSEAIQTIISWESKYRGGIRRKMKPRLTDTNLRKAHYILYLKTTGLTDKLIAEKMNSLRLRTIKNRVWNREKVKKYRRTYRDTTPPEDFEPIEYERLHAEFAKINEEKHINRMISDIKNRVSFD